MMPTASLFLTFVIVVQLFSATAVASESLLSPVPHAKLIKTLDNINLAEVNKTIHSKSGYTWLATAEGLIRFDGYNARQYKYEGNNNSLSHNTVMDVIEDQQQNLWIATFGGGLNKFTPSTGRFEKIDLRVSMEESGESNESDESGESGESDDLKDTEGLYFLSIDKQRHLWIGSKGGLHRFDLNSEKALPLPEALNVLPNGITNGAYIDHKGNFWIGTYNEGLYHYDPQSKQLQQYLHDAKNDNSLSNNNIRTTYLDEHNNLWVGTSMGLCRYNPANNNFERFTPSSQPGFVTMQDDIPAIQSDQQGNLWLGTMTAGTLRFSTQTEQFTAISGPRDLNKKFSASRVNAILLDKDETLWFSTSAGVVLLTEKARRFKFLSNASGTLQVTNISPLHSGKIGLIGGWQFYHYDQSCHCVTPQHDAIKQAYRVTQDKSNDLWFSSLGTGMYHYSASSQTLEAFAYNTTPPSVPHKNLSGITIDDQDRIWLTPFLGQPESKGGLYRFDRNTQRYETYLSEPWIVDIKQHGNNQLLLVTDLIGLITMDIETGQSRQWRKDIPSTPLLSWAMFIDSNDNLWLGTRGQGLAYFDRNSQSFAFYTTEDGLLSNEIVSIIEDNDHNLWLGTSVGLSRFNPQTRQVMNLEQQDGLQFSKLSRGTVYKTPDGQLMFGSHSGFVTFDPADFATHNRAPKIVINDFRLLNQTVKLTDEDSTSPLKKPIEFSDQITLSHKDDVFSFGFAALEYNRPDKIQFAYRMEGLNNDWIYTDGSNRLASYTTLPDGDYIFRVKATNADGQWSDEQASINVTILPPWWLTWQAYVVYVLTGLGGLILYIRLHTAKLHKQARVLELNVEERTKQLQQSNQQLEQSHQQLAQKTQAVEDLLAQKQRLFASVSHEFRTPLTLILSPVDQLLSSPKGQPLNKELNLIKRSGRRLLRMVDQLLEFAKLEQKTSTATELVSLEKTVGIITASFEALVHTKQLTLHVAPFEDVTLSVMPDSLNKILINILSNAVKYTPAGGEINLSVIQQDDHVQIGVTDTGVGIAEHDLEAIFERFNRASHNHDETVSGAGIGLALVKELVEANHGKIELQSQPGQGSTFTITLPKTSEEQDSQVSVQQHQVLNERLDLEIDSISVVQTPKEADPKEQQNQDNNKKSILLVDDNADMRQLLNDQLSEQYRCFSAPNGQIGLAIALEQLPDLIISDVMMPVMDGYELAEALKGNELTSHIPIILLTAKGSLESRIKGLQLLVDDYLAKPFNVEELTLRIHNILTIRDIVRKRWGQAIDGLKSAEQAEQLGLSETEQGFLAKVNKQLEQNHTDIEFNASILSQQLALSERQLQRKVKALLDVSIPEMVRNYRLGKAVILLDEGHRASQVYYNIGFASHSYFSSCFKAKFGMTPSEYQKKT